MFETRPDFEQWVPAPIATKGSHYWRLVVLSSNLPWYLLSYRVRTDDDDMFLIETCAIAFESTLLTVISSLERESIVGLSIMVPDYEVGGWSLRHVTEVWIAAPQETQDAGPLLFRLQDAPELLSTHLEPVNDSSTQRTLLARFY